MPYSQELGMRVYDPSEGYNRGLQLGQFASRGMASAMDERKMKMAEEEAALRRQMHMERAVALEAMNREIKEKITADPTQTEEDIRMKVFPKYADSILGIDNAAQYYSQLPYRQAQIEYTKARQLEAAKPSFQPRMVQVDGPDGKPVSLIQVGPNSYSKLDAPEGKPSDLLAKEREHRMAYASAMKDKRVVDLLEKRKPISDEYVKQKAAGPWMWPIEGKEKHEAQLKRLEEALKEIDDQISAIQKKYGVTSPDMDESEPEPSTEAVTISEPTLKRRVWDPLKEDYAD